MGMTYEEYWYGDPLMVRAFYKAEKIRQKRINEEAWLYGAYVHRAVRSALSISEFFRPKNQRPDEYPQKPIEFSGSKEVETEVEKENRENREALWAQAYMESMVQAGKNWHK